MTLYSSGLEVLIPKGRMLPPGDSTMIPLNWMLELQPSQFGLLVSLNQWAKRVTVLAGVINHQGETGQLPHDRVCKAGYVEYRSSLKASLRVNHHVL